MREPLTVSNIESSTHWGITKTAIQVSINRQLTDEENNFINKCNQEIQNLLILNDEKNDPRTHAEIADQKVGLLGCFPSSFIYAKPIKNEYTLNNIYPWYKVTTHIGDIIIGWRKRVINIDWSESEQFLSAAELFPFENVTMGDRHIHVWGYEKAKEYINKILSL